ncbi:hypothetical protein Tco_1546894 [Tanacetum coccineum]
MQKEYVSKQGRKSAKDEPSIHKVPFFDELADDTLVYMDTENAQDVGRTRYVVHEEKESAEDAVSTEDVVSTDKERVSTYRSKVSIDKSKVSTDRSRVSTDKEEVSIDRPDEGMIIKLKEDMILHYLRTTTTQLYLLKDVEETKRPRPTSTRSLLTLKPLPKIDPKDKGKKKIKEEDESDTESMKGILEAEKKFKQLARDEEMARKVQEDWEAEEEVKKLAEEEATNAALIQDFDDIKARIKADRLLAFFGDNETIAQVLLNMSQAKAVSREKEKGVELKDVEKTERPRPTSTRSLLTLKPLPKIDPKDKGKKKIEEEDESDTESEGIPKAEKKFKQLARDEEMDRKVQEDWETEEERKRLAEEEATNDALIQDFDDTKARIEADRLLALRLQEKERESSSLFDESFTVVGSTEDERKIKEMNEGAKDLEQKRLKKKVAKETTKKEDTAKVPAKVDVTEQGTIDSEIMEKKSFISKLDKGDLKIMMESSKEENDQSNFWNNQQNWEIDTWRLYEACGVYILELEDGTVIHMLVERRYPLSKDLMQRMLDFGLEVEIESTVALDLIRFIKQQIDEE